MTHPLLGCIADDFTGATDLASNLVESGMRVVQSLGVPASMDDLADSDAIVIALKTRSVPREEAVRQSLDAFASLRSIGTARFYFKYCSTFDSTDQGNIGPVAGALLEPAGAEQTIFCPAFPDNGRTVYQGHLFVGNRLLSESGMQHHPLNPMTDSDLVRVLARQTQHRVGCVAHPIVHDGVEAVRRALQAEREAQRLFSVIDALSNRDLHTIAAACAGMPLLTGGSGLALGLPAAYRASGLLSAVATSPRMPHVTGRTAILSGSCSAATLQQIEWMQSRCPSMRLQPSECVQRPVTLIDDTVHWAGAQPSGRPVLIFSSASASEVATVQSEYGRETVARAIERVMGGIASTLVEKSGFRRLIVAGGETAGAVVSELGIHTLRIGPRIVPGVPWTESIDEPAIALALKSGNFGGVDFFGVATEMLA